MSDFIQQSFELIRDSAPFEYNLGQQVGIVLADQSADADSPHAFMEQLFVTIDDYATTHEDVDVIKASPAFLLGAVSATLSTQKAFADTRESLKGVSNV